MHLIPLQRSAAMKYRSISMLSVLSLIGRFVHGFSSQITSCQTYGFAKTTNLACTLLYKI